MPAAARRALQSGEPSCSNVATRAGAHAWSTSSSDTAGLIPVRPLGSALSRRETADASAAFRPARKLVADADQAVLEAHVLPGEPEGLSLPKSRHGEGAEQDAGAGRSRLDELADLGRREDALRLPVLDPRLLFGFELGERVFHEPPAAPSEAEEASERRERGLDRPRGVSSLPPCRDAAGEIVGRDLLELHPADLGEHLGTKPVRVSFERPLPTLLREHEPAEVGKELLDGLLYRAPFGSRHLAAAVGRHEVGMGTTRLRPVAGVERDAPLAAVDDEIGPVRLAAGG